MDGWMDKCEDEWKNRHTGLDERVVVRDIAEELSLRWRNWKGKGIKYKLRCQNISQNLRAWMKTQHRTGRRNKLVTRGETFVAVAQDKVLREVSAASSPVDTLLETQSAVERPPPGRAHLLGLRRRTHPGLSRVRRSAQPLTSGLRGTRWIREDLGK